MREVLYVSGQKVHSMFLDASRPRRQLVEGTLGVPGVAGAKFSVESGQMIDPSNSADLATKLEEIIRYLDRGRRATVCTSSTLQSNQWITFDLEMVYGTSHRDADGREANDDVVLFGGTMAASDTEDSRAVDLLLCGSVHHLRDRITSHGRMGSDTDWLHLLIKSVEERENGGVHVVPEFLSSIAPSNRGGSDPANQARGAFSGLMLAGAPHLLSGRLRGHARVLMHHDDSNYHSRFVLATPLYVEIPHPAKSVSGWRGLRRR